MDRVTNSQVWEVNVTAPCDGVHSLEVSVEDERKNIATDEIRVVTGNLTDESALKAIRTTHWRLGRSTGWSAPNSDQIKPVRIGDNPDRGRHRARSSALIAPSVSH
jgi:hypothetical protein